MTSSSNPECPPIEFDVSKQTKIPSTGFLASDAAMSVVRADSKAEKTKKKTKILHYQTHD